MREKKEQKKRVRFKKVFHALDVTHPFLIFENTEIGPLAPPGDMHFAPQILLVLSGALEMQYRSFKVVCRSGEFCLTGPWEPHRAILMPGKVRYIVITLDLAQTGAVSPFHDADWIHPFLLAPEERPIFSSRRERAMILRAARELLRVEKHACQGFHSYQWMEIHRLLWFIQARKPKFEDRTSSAFRKIFPAIALARNENMRAISLDEAAMACGLSRSRFSALFKQETGGSFGEFAMRGRIHAAATALTGGMGESLKQIASDYGFSDVSHFYRVFRKVLGCTPMEFVAEKQQSSHPLV